MKKTVRNFNYTGRKNLPKGHAQVELKLGQKGAASNFRAALSLPADELFADARVFVEAYHRTALLRFDYGTVKTAATFADVWHTLEGLQNPIASFRVKVVGVHGEAKGRILAVIEKIRPSIQDELEALPSSLLFVAYSPDMGDRPWRVVLDAEAAMPTLEVNEAMGLTSIVVRSSPAFVGLVLPAVLEQVLTYILLSKEDLIEGLADDADDEWGWQWLKFASRLQQRKLDVAELRGMMDDDRRHFIDQAIEAFAARHGLAKLLGSVAWEAGA